MICYRSAKSFCKDDISLIENYEEAINSSETWDCHHRLETDLNLTRDELKEQNLYFNRPASELIFLTRTEHNRWHNIGKPSGTIGKTPWNKGRNDLKGIIGGRPKGQEPHNKGKKLHIREDGTHYYA